MSWLTRVRNALPFAPKRETPDNLWVKCPACSEMLFTREYEDNLYVCPRCEHHGRIGADTRLGQILDPGYELLPAPEVREDPLKFRDTKKYVDRLKTARVPSMVPSAAVKASGWALLARAVLSRSTYFLVSRNLSGSSRTSGAGSSS